MIPEKPNVTLSLEKQLTQINMHRAIDSANPEELRDIAKDLVSLYLCQQAIVADLVREKIGGS